MANAIETFELERLLQKGEVQLVEVLPAAEYRQEHLPGARNIPLTKLTREAVADLDPSRPVVVYCFDYQCDLSPRAAHRLELLGFREVYDYVAGKAAWMAEGLPFEGSCGPAERVGRVSRDDVPRVDARATLAEAAGQFDRGADGEGVAVVLDDEQVVLGVLHRDALGRDPATPVLDAVEPGPHTFRPSTPKAELADYFRKNGLDWGLVTTLDGRWVGIVRRTDLADG